MDSQPRKVEMFFFPFLGGGHLIPMIDLARLFASHGVNSTILSIPNDAAVFHNTVARDRTSGLDIHLHTLQLPADDTLISADMSATPFMDTSALSHSLSDLLRQRRPDCIIADSFHRWVPDAVDPLGIPRVVFNGSCCFSKCCDHSLCLYSPHEQVTSDSEPFLLPNLPNPIELTRSQLSTFVRTKTQLPFNFDRHDQNSLGQLVNSFYDLEPDYVEYCRKVIGTKTWLIGPVSLCNRNTADKVGRGQKASIDEHSCLSWLSSRAPRSVLYISFGSLVQLAPKQLVELAHGLESSNCSFIWVIGVIVERKTEGNTGDYLPQGFEQRVRGRGLVIRGWAPQLLILDHGAVGGFMTHCGWNSTLEGICAGVPMITFPLTAEQFYNEKLVTDVLRIGVKVGSMEWTLYNQEREAVGRERVEAAVSKLMGGGEEAADMARKAEELAEMAKKAVGKGGSSYNDVEAFIEELKSLWD